METTKLYIKNMVCDRCKLVVRAQLKTAGLPFLSVELGEVTLSETPDPDKLDRFRQAIEKDGFELIADRAARTISQIKTQIIEYVREDEDHGRHNFSDYLSEKLAKDYSTLSKLFSEVEGITIEKYLILQKIERVKELLVYDEMNLSQIADALHYSSVQHLSNQFKKVTGLTPSHFKKVGIEKRKPIDKV